MDKIDSVNRNTGGSDVHKETYLAIGNAVSYWIEVPKEGGKPPTSPELRGLLKSS